MESAAGSSAAWGSGSCGEASGAAGTRGSGSACVASAASLGLTGQALVFLADGGLLLAAGISGSEERPHQRQQHEERRDGQADPARSADQEKVPGW